MPSRARADTVAATGVAKATVADPPAVEGVGPFVDAKEAAEVFEAQLGSAIPSDAGIDAVAAAPPATAAATVREACLEECPVCCAVLTRLVV